MVSCIQLTNFSKLKESGIILTHITSSSANVATQSGPSRESTCESVHLVWFLHHIIEAHLLLKKISLQICFSRSSALLRREERALADPTAVTRPAILLRLAFSDDCGKQSRGVPQQYFRFLSNVHGSRVF